MKLKSFLQHCKILSLSVLFLTSAKQTTLADNLVQEDTLFVQEFENVPEIDGSGNEDCWNEIGWQTIDQVWIPLNAQVDSSDFYGRFKIGWSADSNLIYILCEVTDDIWVDGYVFNKEPGVYRFDVLEIFFDEDKSGGYHIYDYFDDKGRPTSTNSENAFAYHIAVDLPNEGEVVRDFVAVDGDGTSAFNNKNMDYSNHFNEMAVIRNGNVTTWELSLMVFDSTYNTDPSNARVTLEEGKVSGLALAYCEDDTPNNINRQNFFGSVPPDLDHLDNNGDFNNCWINADHFGTMKLVKKEQTGQQTSIQPHEKNGNLARVFPNPTITNINLEMKPEMIGNSHIKIFNSTGNVIYYRNPKEKEISISMENRPEGIYFISISNAQVTEIKKFIKL